MFESGILDKTKLLSNLLLVVLLAGNIYLSIQFINNAQKTITEDQTNVVIKIKAARFLKTFIDKVLNTQNAITFEDRVQLENEVLQLHDPVLTTAWNEFVASKTSKEGQTNAVNLMALFVDRV